MGEFAEHPGDVAERPGNVDEVAERTTGTESGGGFKATLSPLFLGLNVLIAPDIENSGKSGDSLPPPGFPLALSSSSSSLSFFFRMSISTRPGAGASELS